MGSSADFERYGNVASIKAIKRYGESRGDAGEEILF